jgi:phenylpyruvate tautomerase PptA (4-oxalocrotonate tautomerase family)
MPMIDVTAATGTFADHHKLARDLAACMMRWEAVPDRDKKLGVVREMTEIVAAAAGDPSLTERTWVLISEAPDGGWGIDGHAFTNAEIAQTARKILVGD